MYEIYLSNGFTRDRKPRNLRQKSAKASRADQELDQTEAADRILQGVDSGDDIISRNVRWIARRRVGFRYFLTSMLLYLLVVTLKDVLIMLLNYLPASSPYRLIDCYLLGRLTLTGSFTQIAQKFGIMITGSQFIWTLFIHIFKPSIKFDCIDFLLHTCDQVQAIELKIKLDRVRDNYEPSHNFEYLRPNLVNLLTSQANLDSLHKHDLYQKSSLTWSSSHKQELYSSPDHEDNIKFELFQYPDHLVTAMPANELRSLNVVRKNRTTSAWKGLVDYTQNYFLISILLVVFSSMGVTYLMASVLFTQQGFELNYHICTDYIRSLDKVEQSNYRYLYEPQQSGRKKPLGVALEMTDFLAPTPYNVIRVLADIVQTSITFSISAATFAFDTYVSVLIVKDVLILVETLQVEMDTLVKHLKLRTCKSHRNAVGGLRAKHIHLKSVPWTLVETNQSEMDLAKQIYSLQAQLADLFMVIGRYNIYNAVFTSIVLVVWLFYSFLAVDYLLATSGIIYYEVIFGQLVATFYFICVVGQFATVAHKVRKLYRSITTAMALDEDTAESKQRWATILTYFHPKPLYCFTLFGFAISWQLCLQVGSKLKSSFCQCFSDNNNILMKMPHSPVDLVLDYHGSSSGGKYVVHKINPTRPSYTV